MIRAMYRDGVIQPREPVPAHWKDGTMVRVSTSEDELRGLQPNSDDAGEEERSETTKNLE